MAEPTTSEARFSHLLEPIRDLAQNWNVDIASEVTDAARAEPVQYPRGTPEQVQLP